MKISKLTLLILLTLLAPRGGVKILSLLLGMSYNKPKMLSSKFQSPSIKIEDVCRDGVREKAIQSLTIRNQILEAYPSIWSLRFRGQYLEPGLAF